MTEFNQPAGINAVWFDGITARRLEVVLQASSRSVAVLSTTGERIALVPKDMVRVCERIANTPYRLEFPNGALAMSTDHAAIERSFTLDPRAHWLAKLEGQPWAVVMAMLGLFVSLYFAYNYFLPIAAESVAQRIPRESEATLGQMSMKGLDNFFDPSKLSETQMAPIRAEFDRLAEVSGLKGVVKLEFRAMPPNALAIPGGTVIITDGLVKLFNGDERKIGAVIAHELGHVHHRHSLKHLLEGSASSLIVGAMLGDVTGVSTLVTTAPVILSSLHFTRESEAQADQYAFELLKKAGRTPMDFANAMRTFQAMEDCMTLKSKDSGGKFNRRLSRASESDDDDDDDDGDGDGDEAENKRSKEEKELKEVTREKLNRKRNICTIDPESYLRERSEELAQMKKDDAEHKTGYLHTHPVTQERIHAAEAAAK